MTARIAVMAALSLAVCRLLFWMAPFPSAVRLSPLVRLRFAPADPRQLAGIVERVGRRIPAAVCEPVFQHDRDPGCFRKLA